MVDKLKIQRLLIRINRISCWLLLLVVIIYIITGYSMTGRYSFNRLIRPRLALSYHNIMHAPLIILFLIHVGISIYFASKRWRLFRKKE